MDAKDAKAEKKGGVWRDHETRAIKRVAFERILLPFPALLPMTETSFLLQLSVGPANVVTAEAATCRWRDHGRCLHKRFVRRRSCHAPATSWATRTLRRLLKSLQRPKTMRPQSTSEPYSNCCSTAPSESIAHHCALVCFSWQLLRTFRGEVPAILFSEWHRDVPYCP